MDLPLPPVPMRRPPRRPGLPPYLSYPPCPRCLRCLRCLPALLLLAACSMPYRPARFTAPGTTFPGLAQFVAQAPANRTDISSDML